MGKFVIQLSDVGEGVAEAELIEWHVAVGDTVAEDQLLGVVMTDKAAVEIPSSVLGKVTRLCANIGDVVAVGAELIHLDVDGVSAVGDSANPEVDRDERTEQIEQVEQVEQVEQIGATAQTEQSEPFTKTVQSDENRVLAAPTVRKRARELGVELSSVAGSGSGGRVVHDDLDQFTERRAAPNQGGLRDGTSGRAQPNTSVNTVKVVGLRRKIAEKMALSKARIPHITIVEEIDVHYLEELREEVNTTHSDTRGKLTMLPFLTKAIVESVREHPEMNAHYHDEVEEFVQYGGVHIGVAAQTDNGLMVPVVRHCETLTLWETATEVKRLSDACREGKAQREELSGSTITITSLGALGAIATTPIINHPEVAIVGVNKMVLRPHWDGQQFVPRKTMNISCSFDHRVIDGYDAAVFVQKMKSLLEKPAMLFLDQ